jgi:hypothetical protein
VAHFDLLGAFDEAGNEFISDVFLNENSRRAGADLALVQRKQRRTFEAFVEEGVLDVEDPLAAELRLMAGWLELVRVKVVSKKGFARRLSIALKERT